jgi:hypothetical protein
MAQINELISLKEATSFMEPGDVVCIGSRRCEVVSESIDAYNLVSTKGDALTLDKEGFLYNADGSLLDVSESTISFPRGELTNYVWNKVDGHYILKPEVKEMILKYLKLYPAFDLIGTADEIRLVGSLCSGSYDSSSDLDVHLAIEDLRNLPADKTPEEWQKDVKKFYKHLPEEEQVKVGDTYPIEVFLNITPNNDFLSTGVYNVLTDEWEKEPEIKDLQFDPLDFYSEAYDEVRDLAHEADVDIGELKMDLIDYQDVKAAIARLPQDAKTELGVRLRKKVMDIEADVDDLFKDKEDWVALRRSGASIVTKEQALADLKYVQKFRQKDAVFKLLARYGYMRIISDIEKAVGDEDEVSDLSDEEIKNIAKAVGVTEG